MVAKIMQRRGIKGLLLVGFWVSVGLIYEGMKFLAYTTVGEPYSLTDGVWSLVGWYTWVPASLIVLWFARHFPVERRNWLRVLPVHFVGAVLTSLFTYVLYHTVAGGFAMANGQPYVFFERIQVSFGRYLAFDSTLYVTILAGIHAFDYYRRYQERVLQTAELKAQLAEARLKALQMQLHPHFLFNTLNTVAMLIRQHDDRGATNMIAGLSSLLRRALEDEDRHEVPLAEELGFAEQYLEIERVRFQDRLDVHIEIASDSLDALVPSLLLQPLIENALRHGIDAKGEAGRIEVHGWREDDTLCLEVRDDGAGLPDGWSLQKNRGIGLRNTVARLKQLYGPDARIKFVSQPGEGLQIQLRLPFRLHPTAPAESIADALVQAA